TRTAELRKDLDFLLRADDTGFVYYLDVRGRGVFLRASPIDVSSIVADLLLDRMNGTVLTSATLTVDGSFEYVRSRLGIRRAQETAPRSALLRDFKTTPNAVLLATSSFWQGVDVVGEALSCVIIDKLPFASPGDPITSARIEQINAAGGSAFGEYQIPLAIL